MYEVGTTSAEDAKAVADLLDSALPIFQKGADIAKGFFPKPEEKKKKKKESKPFYKSPIVVAGGLVLASVIALVIVKRKKK